MTNRLLLGVGLVVGILSAVRADPTPQERYAARHSSHNTEKRNTAVALGQSQDASKAGPELLKMIDDKDVMTRVLAIQGLGRLKYAPARSAIATKMTSDSSENVRLAASTTLAQLGDPKAGPILVKALKDNSVRVRMSALQGLGELKDAKYKSAIQSACADTDPGVHAAAEDALKKIQPELKCGA